MFLLDVRKKLDTSNLKKIRGGHPLCGDGCYCICECRLSDCAKAEDMLHNRTEDFDEIRRLLF